MSVRTTQFDPLNIVILTVLGTYLNKGMINLSTDWANDSALIEQWIRLKYRFPDAISFGVCYLPKKHKILKEYIKYWSPLKIDSLEILTPYYGSDCLFEPRLEKYI